MGHPLEARLQTLPRGPGVYLFKDGAGRVIYIGKASSLRTRVRSYFRRGGDGRVVVRFIEERARDLEVIATRSEKEAFLLENNLIKQKKPRYNIRLRDDKTFLHLKVDRRHPFPAIVPMRRPRKDGALYFGPYASARAIRTTLRMLRSIFPLRDCSDHEFENRSRPCLKYQIKMCSAPCVDYVSEAEYGRDLEGAIEVLRGNTTEVAEHLVQEMQEASGQRQYERAAALRDRIAFLRTSTEAQAVEVGRYVDRDVLGLHRRGRQVALSVLFIRSGKLLSVEPFSLQSDLPDDETLSTFLGQFYRSGRPLPDEVLLPTAAYASELLEEVLSERRGRALRVRVPRGGEAGRQVVMACRNAELSLQADREEQSLQRRILEDVRRRLALPRAPRRLECVDVSHLQGSQAVASLVCFVDGEPAKEGYRRYRLRTSRNDDPASMREVAERRFGPRAAEEGLPDLLLVDGGRAQVRAVVETLEGLGRSAVRVAGIVKPPRRGRGLALPLGEEERVVLPDRSEPVILPSEAEACYFLQRVRDEAHRFAIQYHRRLRSREQRTGELAGIEGLGPGRISSLLQFFGGMRQLRAASQEDLARAPGIGPRLAVRIHRELHPD